MHRNSDGSAVIGVNSVDNPRRQRFTIAHELGHLVLHGSQDLHIDEEFPIGLRNRISGMAVDEREIEANQFAAELLMPSDLMGADVELLRSRGTPVEEAIAKLSQRYKVSADAMTIRLSSLDLIRI